MQVFKTAIKTVLRHPMYLIVYAGFLSMMGVFIASGLTFGGTNDSEFSPYETKFAVIDRDGSALSDGLAAYLREQGIEVPIEDSQMALQDAVAKGQSSYILIVPEGFGDAFVEAARTGDELPTLETVYSFYSTEGSLMCNTQPRSWPNRRKRTAWKWAEPRPRRSGSCSSSNGAPTPCSPPSSCASA